MLARDFDSRDRMGSLRSVGSSPDGIPIGVDCDKGAYVVVPSGAVVLRSPNVPGGELLVASSVADLQRFTPSTS